MDPDSTVECVDREIVEWTAKTLADLSQYSGSNRNRIYMFMFYIVYLMFLLTSCVVLEACARCCCGFLLLLIFLLLVFLHLLLATFVTAVEAQHPGGQGRSRRAKGRPREAP